MVLGNHRGSSENGAGSWWDRHKVPATHQSLQHLRSCWFAVGHGLPKPGEVVLALVLAATYSQQH